MQRSLEPLRRARVFAFALLVAVASAQAACTLDPARGRTPAAEAAQHEDASDRLAIAALVDTIERYPGLTPRFVKRQPLALRAVARAAPAPSVVRTRAAGEPGPAVCPGGVELTRWCIAHSTATAAA
jgi:hypothetical protein